MCVLTHVMMGCLFTRMLCTATHLSHDRSAVCKCSSEACTNAEPACMAFATSFRTSTGTVPRDAARIRRCLAFPARGCYTVLHALSLRARFALVPGDEVGGPPLPLVSPVHAVCSACKMTKTCRCNRELADCVNAARLQYRHGRIARGHAHHPGSGPSLKDRGGVLVHGPSVRYKPGSTKSRLTALRQRCKNVGCLFHTQGQNARRRTWAEGAAAAAIAQSASRSG